MPPSVIEKARKKVPWGVKTPDFRADVTGTKNIAKIRRYSKGNMAALTDPQSCTWAFWVIEDSTKY